jgi:putative transposase
MARFARAVAVGSAHHITQRGVDRQRVFHTDSDRRTYLGLLTVASAQAHLQVLAYCLMNNHVHLIAVPEEPTSMAVALRSTHGRYAAYLNARRARSGHLWQNRFFSCALGETHLRAALRYVERNPVRAQLARQPQDYPWSSAAAHLGLCPMPALLHPSLVMVFGGFEDWRALLAEPEELTAIRSLQRCTFSGRPFGNQSFVESLEQRLDRKLLPRQGARTDLHRDTLSAC